MMTKLSPLKNTLDQYLKTFTQHTKMLGEGRLLIFFHQTFLTALYKGKAVCSARNSLLKKPKRPQGDYALKTEKANEIF